MNRPLIILGLDGLALDESGSGVRTHMPFLSHLVGKHRVITVDAALPNNSMACWTSWFTGLDPSRHGIPDFVLFDKTVGLYRLTQSSDRAAPALWDMATRAEKRCVIFNVPGTFPANQVKGLMIAGAPALSRQGLTYPAPPPSSIAKILSGYRGDLDFELPSGTEESEMRRTAESIREGLDRQIALIEALLNEPWDIFAGVVTMTDRLLHYFIHHLRGLDEPVTQTASVVWNAFRRLDGFLERTILAWRNRAGIVIVSDHGFVPCRCQFHLGEWLARRGWFVPRAPNAAPVNSGWIDFPGSDRERSLFIPAPASSLGIWVRDTPAISPSPRGDNVEELMEALREVIGPDGRTVFQRVARREEIYDGPCAGRLPDVLLVPRGGETALTAQPGEALFSSPPRPGAHSLKSYLLALDGDADSTLGYASLLDYWNRGSTV